MGAQTASRGEAERAVAAGTVQDKAWGDPIGSTSHIWNYRTVSTLWLFPFVPRK